MNEEQKYIDFEAYERVSEPHIRERVSAWRTAIGLQDVDGLRVSDCLKEIAVKHIEGDITIDEVREQLQSYYVNKTTHDADDAEKEEANRVAANITKLLNEKSFSLTSLEFLNIHRHLFEVSLSMLVRFVPMTSVKRNGYYKVIQLYMVVQQTFMKH